MSTTLEKTILTRAIQIMETGHTRGVFARDAGSREVSWWSKRAARFCALGALYRAVRETVGEGELELELVSQYERNLGSAVCVWRLNDGYGKRAAIQHFEKRLCKL